MKPPDHQHSPQRQELEAMIDKFIADSFPASDPPSWSCLGDRMDEIVP